MQARSEVATANPFRAVEKGFAGQLVKYMVDHGSPCRTFTYSLIGM